MSQVAWLDCAGGSPVVVERGIAYVGNMRNPRGTLIIGVVGRTTAPNSTTNERTRLVDEGSRPENP